MLELEQEVAHSVFELERGMLVSGELLSCSNEQLVEWEPLGEKDVSIKDQLERSLSSDLGFSSSSSRISSSSSNPSSSGSRSSSAPDSECLLSFFSFLICATYASSIGVLPFPFSIPALSGNALSKWYKILSLSSSLSTRDAAK